MESFLFFSFFFNVKAGKVEEAFQHTKELAKLSINFLYLFQTKFYNINQ